MKLLIAILVLFTAVAVYTDANAGFISATSSATPDNNVKPNFPTPQDKPKGPPIMHLPSIIDCSSPQNILSLVEGQFKEIPFINGGTVVKRPDGVIMPALMTLYVNIEAGTYSLVAKFPEVSLWCIINSGGNFKPAIPEKQT